MKRLAAAFLLILAAPAYAASTSISSLPSAAAVNLGDVVPLTQGSTGPGTGVTRGATVQQIMQAINADISITGGTISGADVSGTNVTQNGTTKTLAAWLGNMTGAAWLTVQEAFGDATQRTGSPALSWVGNDPDAGTDMQYWDTTGQFSSYRTGGGFGLEGATRLGSSGTGAAIGVGGYGNNDSTQSGTGVWGGYFKGVRRSVAPGSALGVEVNSTNLGPLVANSSYVIGPYGTTAALWASVGGEQAEFGTTVNPSSVALGIVSTTNAAHGAVYDKGIVFEANALKGDDGTNGTATAVQMGKGQEIQWIYDTSSTRGGFIRSDANTSGFGILFENDGVHIVLGSNESTIVKIDTSGDLSANGSLTIGAGIVDTATDVEKPSANATLTFPAGKDMMVINASGGTAFTVNLPASPLDGQIAELACTGSYTLTLASGSVGMAMPSSQTCSSSQGHRWRYVGAVGGWVQIN